MHIVEVDLNYTQYHPLSETYISLYPPSSTIDEEGDAPKKEKEKERPKPAMWAEVEKAMEEGTLNRLRNRMPNAPIKISKPVESRPVKAAKPRPEPAPIDTTGLNRRQRRKLLGIQDSRGKNKPTLSSKKHDSGAGQGDNGDADQDDTSDGGFFED